MQKECFFIEVCGIDGAGKSSIVDTLESEAFLDSSCYLRKTDRRNGELIKKYFNRPYGDHRDWDDQEFAKQWGWCGIFDFLYHYDTEVSDKRKQFSYIFFDRYVTGVWAYAFAYGLESSARRLLHAVKPADLVLYIEADLDRVLRRYETRGARGDDENRIVMQRYLDGFETILPKIGSQLVRIDNNGDFEQTMQAVKTAITAAIR